MFWWACGAAAHSGDAVPSYNTRVWTTDQGLPGSRVNVVIQSRDGYLWLGTRSGLARFDGVRFTVFDGGNTPEMTSSHVTCLFEDSAGTIWIGHETGELTCFRAGKFQAVPVKASWQGGMLFGIGADSAGDVWLIDEAGEMARVKDGFVIPAPQGKVVHLLALAAKPGGGLWIQRDNEVSELEGGRLRPIEFDETPGDHYIKGIGAAQDGGLWVLTATRILKWKSGRWAEDLRPAPWGDTPVHSLMETKQGHLAAATSDHGLYLIFRGHGSLQLCHTNGFPEDWITSLCEDREGNLWAGTGNSGLAMLRAGNISTLGPPDLWQGRAVLSVASGSDGALWVGTEGAGLYRFHDGIWTNFDESAGLRHRYVWSVLPDVQGRTWAGTWGGSLMGWNGSRFEVLPDLKNFDAPIPALSALPNGGLLIGTGIGLMRYEAGRITWLAREPEVALPDVRAVIEAPDGTRWLGLSGGGLVRIQPGSLRQFRRSDGLSSDFVQCLHLDNDGTLWIGTLGGLNRFKDGRFVVITRKQGLANDTICDLEDDGRGYYWISSHGGILRVDKAELNRCADGQINRFQCLTYGLSDGLPTLECSGGFQPAACRTGDGRLWFPTSKGLVAVDPGKVTTNTLVPPVVIERLLVDDQAMDANTAPASQFQIAPGRHRVEFQFTGLSFVAPEKVRFKYRLTGLDPDWVDAGMDRTADLGYVPPGNYTFQVIACNNDGVWNEEGAVLAFTLLPHFWHTWWFRALAGGLIIAASGGAVWLDARRRMRRKLEQIERQRAVENERARIANDIHDDLGASLTRITMLSESARNGMHNSRQISGCLDQIHDTARELTRAMGEVVWAINPRHDTLESLAVYLEQYGQNFLKAAGIRCQIDLPLELPARVLTADVRHNLFLAFKEALHNAVKHAGASEVRISLKLEPASFALTIEDNGSGFVPGTAPDRPPAGSDRRVTGNGLANMRRRFTDISGRCEIQSAQGQGTKVKFVVMLEQPPGQTNRREVISP